MARIDHKNPETRNEPGNNSGEARRPHSIRLSDSEWSLIEQAVARHGLSAGKLVRSGALATVEDRLGESPPATLSTGHIALIEATYRAAYVLATLNREQLLDAGRENDLHDLVAEAHNAMAETMNEGPA